MKVTLTSADLRNIIGIANSLDRHEIDHQKLMPLSDDEWHRLQKDPLGAFMRAGDDIQRAFAAALDVRMP